MVATDRRTSGTQVEDETIELKANGRIREALGERGNVSVTSYNRIVLLTGEVPNEADKATGRSRGRADRQRPVGRQRARRRASARSFV